MRRTCWAWCCACSSIWRSLVLILSWRCACDLFPSSSSPVRLWDLPRRTFSCSTVFFRCLLSFLQSPKKPVYLYDCRCAKLIQWWGRVSIKMNRTRDQGKISRLDYIKWPTDLRVPEEDFLQNSENTYLYFEWTCSNLDAMWRHSSRNFCTRLDWLLINSSYSLIVSAGI